MDTQLIKIEDVQARFGISHATVYRWIKLGILPRPLKMGRSYNSALRFKESDLLAALAKIEGAA